ncbi:MAG: hypothetical protein ACRC1H_02080, partial [Caldilineaceae bacterium]
MTPLATPNSVDAVWQPQAYGAPSIQDAEIIDVRPVEVAGRGSVGVVQTQSFTFALDEPYLLESGATLAPVTIAYETYGRLNADRSNAILICHALSGGAHAAGYHSDHDTQPGWWHDCIGPGKAFDTDRFFV